MSYLAAWKQQGLNPYDDIFIRKTIEHVIAKSSLIVLGYYNPSVISISAVSSSYLQKTSSKPAQIGEFKAGKRIRICSETFRKSFIKISFSGAFNGSRREPAFVMG
jgi:hypothetical protein